MRKVCCDVCGSPIEIGLDGKAFCLNCGISYSIEAIRSKFRADSESCISQNDSYQKTLQMYLDNFDWEHAEQLCTTVLAAYPNDTFAQKAYLDLRELRNFEIVGTVLVKYHGNSQLIRIPHGVTEIARGAFGGISVSELIIPGSVRCFTTQFTFNHSHDIRVSSKIIFEEGVESIGHPNYASSLNSLYEVFNRDNLQIILPKSLQFIDKTAFYYRYSSNDGPDQDKPYLESKLVFPNGKSHAVERLIRQHYNKCVHCGGSFQKILFSAERCTNCGAKKEYR